MQQRKLNSLMLDWSVDWAELFGAERPLIVEIGFGNADYAIALAQSNPNCNVVGFEVSSQSMFKSEKKIIRHQLPNIRAIHSRGETALHHLFTPASVREIHINYPDPWFKSRHAGRRIMQRDTLDAIVSRLEPDGLFFLATDIVDYAEMSHELLAETKGLDNLLDAPYVHEFSERLITTKYEEKGIREGRRGNYFKYRRNTHPAPYVPVKEELPMPHIVLKTPMPPQDIAAQMEKMAFHANDIHVVVLNAYWNPNYQTVLFDVVIEEPTIDQHIALLLHPREKTAAVSTASTAAA
ncbi:MAG: tRNA (guanosine(46)-N7)-methyltransferase TrmB, partial [Anaerolineae bacterium]|nr:tRNA (guanosine(46)-N7)-methyltransferase TrmB [Anaerolineae bacterium]